MAAPAFIHRGVIEGFYGPPYVHADRLWLIERLGAWGMNRYVYAPKDDPLHRAEWRSPYGETTLAECGTCRDYVPAVTTQTVQTV